jgi:hypothetical protein
LIGFTATRSEGFVDRHPGSDRRAAGRHRNETYSGEEEADEEVFEFERFAKFHRSWGVYIFIELYIDKNGKTNTTIFLNERDETSSLKMKVCYFVFFWNSSVAIGERVICGCPCQSILKKNDAAGVLNSYSQLQLNPILKKKYYIYYYP